jgi:hypothetical protein
MIIPSAYQVTNSFRSNIAGQPYDILSLSPNSRYDSWLTIGITDGDPDNQLGTIGIDFSSWDLNNPLVIDNGAVFLMNPDHDLNGLTEIIIGQLTIPTHVSSEAIINVQGKLRYSEDVWKQHNIVFTITPPVRRNNEGIIPQYCQLWYDGCNTCSVNNGVLGRCTRIMCLYDDSPHCLDLNIPGH